MNTATARATPGTRRTKVRADGATIACLFVLALTIIPARLIFKGLPLAMSPAMAIGLAMGLLWFCAQLVTTLGVAKGRNAVRTALFLFAASQLATYGYATFTYLPPDELAAADRTLITLAAFVLVGIAVCDGVRGLARIDRLLKIMVVGATFMAAVGVLQFAAAIDLTQYLMPPGLRTAGEISFVLERSSFRRPAGTAEHPIEFGVVCAMAAPLALHYLFRARSIGAPQLRWWFCLAILAVAAMQSLSRSAVLGLAVAGLVLIPFMPRGRRWRAVVLAGLFVLAMRIMVPGLVGTLYSLFTNISVDTSTESRTRAIERAGAEIAEHFVLGRGFGTYVPEKYGYVDNQYLGTLVQNGIVGLAALLLVLLAGLYAAVRARLLSRDPVVRDLGITLTACVCVPAVSAATFDLLAFSVATGYMFLLIGCAGALLRAAREDQREDQGVPP
ncbi:O-antigen ligase [Herbihabitans rhizosphaerae]|uniref:O-antigen ligase n=1 Tax=Herbihabitans rhizosphaerae TaxID=1872711 RepID=A0A4Q7KW82_9PSEU|nr:O-antigen ligase family protein [Herbihabitans rhizosphaerae]RZS40907.1 O-antigen ligase [Herbihabitans rhizosphaerae]